MEIKQKKVVDIRKQVFQEKSVGLVQGLLIFFGKTRLKKANVKKRKEGGIQNSENQCFMLTRK